MDREGTEAEDDARERGLDGRQIWVLLLLLLAAVDRRIEKSSKQSSKCSARDGAVTCLLLQESSRANALGTVSQCMTYVQ